METALKRLRQMLGLDRRSSVSPGKKTAAASRIQAARQQAQLVLPTKACPFCGMRPAEVCDDSWCSDGGFYFQIVCLPCGAAGPQAATEDAAWRSWNERTAPKEH